MTTFSPIPFKTVDDIPLSLCFTVVGGFLTLGMLLGYYAFKSSIK